MQPNVVQHFGTGRSGALEGSWTSSGRHAMDLGLRQLLSGPSSYGIRIQRMMAEWRKFEFEIRKFGELLFW